MNLATEKATVRALSTVSVSTLKAAVEKAGYTAKDIADHKPAPTEAAAGLVAVSRSALR